MIINESKFSMWRATIHLVLVDGKVTQAEKDWLNKYILKVPFSEEQKKIIQEDLKSPRDNFQFLYDKITHPPDRAMLVHFANMIFKSDGEFHENEKEFLDMLNKAVITKVDMLNAISKLDQGKQLEERQKNLYEKAFDFIDQFTFSKD